MTHIAASNTARFFFVLAPPFRNEDCALYLNVRLQKILVKLVGLMLRECLKEKRSWVFSNLPVVVLLGGGMWGAFSGLLRVLRLFVFSGLPLPYLVGSGFSCF